MREIECKILSELMKNSGVSDRELAKKIGSSQPTVTRARARANSTMLNRMEFSKTLDKSF